MNSEEIKALESFIVDNSDLEKLESLIAQINIFEAVGAVKQEIRHSDFLSFLLNPTNNHGLSDIFLKNMLKQVLIGANESPFPYSYNEISSLLEDFAIRTSHQWVAPVSNILFSSFMPLL